MENFIVSARKYRPITFDTVVGQESITTTLRNAIKGNQLAQAFLFCGPRGVGKTTCARILAKTINCTNVSDNVEACDECESCKSFSSNTSMNIYELDAASNNSVDDIRQLVEQVRIPPQSGQYKVYIIDEVHMLSTAAFNAFLKTLEEPPAYAKFILATTEKHKILPTIISRCQIFDFRRIGIPDIANHLEFVAKKEDIKYEKYALSLIAQKADGGLRDALSIFDQIVNATDKNLTYKEVSKNLNVLDYDQFFKITNSIIKKDISSILQEINLVLSQGFDGHHLLIGLGEHFRNLLVSKDSSTLNLLNAEEETLKKYQDQAKIFDTVKLVQSLDLIGKSDINYRSSQNKRLFVEMSLLQIAALHFDEESGQKKKLRLPPTNFVHKVESKETQIKNIKKHIADAKVEEAKVDKVVERKSVPSNGNRRIGTLSIKNFQRNKGVTNEEELTYGPKRTKPFLQNDLNIAWEQYISMIKGTHKIFANAIAISNPKVMDNYEIAYEVQNTLISKDLNNTSNLLAYLKDKLENDLITLKSVTANIKDRKRYYTDGEKLERIIEKYPVVRILKKQLDLDIES
ncbi:MAG: DNA polymerase III subunit gamma/tau [Hyphomicrobiales bacterium]